MRHDGGARLDEAGLRAVADGRDNCPAAAQADRDANGIGDACDIPCGDCAGDGHGTVDEGGEYGGRRAPVVQ